MIQKKQQSQVESNMINITNDTLKYSPTVTSSWNFDEPKPAHEEDFIIDPETGVKRPKFNKPAEKPKGVLPGFRNSLLGQNYDDISEITLSPDDWFLTQSTIMACLPVNGNLIPLELVPYVNGNFNTYPSGDLPKYIDGFRQSLLFKNHNPSKAYGFTLDVKSRPVKVGKFTLNYIDILTAVNKNIDKDFAELIKSRDIKYMSWGHTAGNVLCSICDLEINPEEDENICDHILAMMLRRTPTPAVEGKRPYGIIHKFTENFHVFDVSYLSEKPAYGGAISNSINILENPLLVEVSKSLFQEKAGYACQSNKNLNAPNTIRELLKELHI